MSGISQHLRNLIKDAPPDANIVVPTRVLGNAATEIEHLERTIEVQRELFMTVIIELVERLKS